MRKRKPKDTDRHIGKVIRKLNISDGDILIVKRDSQYGQQDVLDKLGEMFEQHYPFRVIFLVVDDFDDIQKADDKTMMDNGWIRWPRGKAPIPPVEQENEHEEETDSQ